MSELAVGSISGLAANSYVIDVASGSSLDLSNGAVFPAGNVIQVVHATSNTTLSTTSTTYVDSNLSGTITPQYSSSKIVILVNVGRFSTNSSANSSFLRLYRGNTASGAALGTTDMAENYSNDNSFHSGPGSLNWVDSPSTTSAITYTLGVKSGNASNTCQVGFQQSMILMEIAG